MYIINIKIQTLWELMFNNNTHMNWADIEGCRSLQESDKTAAKAG